MATVYDPVTRKYVDDGQPEPVTEDTPEQSGILRRTLGDAGVSLAKGVLVGAPQAVTGLLRLGTLGLADPLLNPVSSTLDNMGKAIDKKFSPEHQQQAQEVADTKGFLPTIGAYLSRPGYILDTVGEQLPTMFAGGILGRAATGGAAAVRRAAAGASEGLVGSEAAAAASAAAQKAAVKAGAVGEGLVTAGQNVEQVDQAIQEGTGDNSSLGSKLLAGLGGAATGAISFGVGSFANKHGIADINTLVAGGSRASREGSMLSSIGKGVLLEGAAEEMPQSMQEQVFNNAALGLPLTQGVLEAGAQGLVLGGVMGGGAQLLGSRPNPAALLKANQARDALAGISVLTEPYQRDAQGNVVLSSDQETALARVAAYARGVEGADLEAVKRWQSEQQANILGGMPVDFTGVPGITNDAHAKAWAQARRDEIVGREQAGQTGQVATDPVVQEGFGELPGRAYREDIPSRSLTKQEQAEVAILNRALAAGDTETIARMQGKLYARQQQQPASASAAVPPSPPQASAKPANPNGVRAWDDAKLAAAHSGLEDDDNSAQAGKIREEIARRAEASVMYADTDPAPKALDRKRGMRSLLRSDGASFSTAAITNVEKELAARLPPNPTTKQLLDTLDSVAADLNAKAPSTAELAGTYAQAIRDRRKGSNVENPPVSQGAESESTTREADAANPGVDSKPAPAGDDTSESAQEAEGEETAPAVVEVAPPAKVAKKRTKKDTTAEAAPPATEAAPPATEAAPPATEAAPPATEAAPPAKAAKKRTKKDTAAPPAAEAEDWDAAYNTAIGLAGRLGLTIAPNGGTLVQADGILSALARKIGTRGDPEVRKRLRDVIQSVHAMRARQADRDAKAQQAKTEADIASATAVLQAEPTVDRAKMPTGVLWDYIRGAATFGTRYIPSWAELQQFLAATKELTQALPDMQSKLKELKAEERAVRQETGKAKKALNTAESRLAKLKQRADTLSYSEAPRTSKAQAQIETYKAAISVATEERDAAQRVYDKLSDRAARLGTAVTDAEREMQQVRGAEQQAAAVDDVLVEFEPNGLARDPVFTRDQLLQRVAEFRLAPYLKMLEKMRADEATAKRKSADHAHAMDRLLDLTDLWHYNGKWLDKLQTEEFMRLYHQVRKGNGKGHTFAQAIEYASTNYPLNLVGGFGVSPLLQTVLETTSGPIKLADMLTVVASTTTQPVHKELARRLIPLAREVNVAYVNEPMPTSVEDGAVRFKTGNYNPSTNTVTVYSGGENAHVILHEAVHAATVASLARAASLKAGDVHTQADRVLMNNYHDLVALYSALKEMPEFKGEYAFKNLYEFVAEVHSNPVLQAHMAAVQAPAGLFGKATAKLGSLMNAFVRAVRGLLGLKEDSTDALTAALELTAGLFDSKVSPSSGEFDSLSTPVTALTTLSTVLPRYTDAVDRWKEKVPFEGLKQTARKLWLGLISTDYIRDMVQHSPGLAEFAQSMSKWFDTDRLKTQVKSMITKDVYDGFLRRLEIALKGTGNYTKYNELLGELAGEASRIGFDITRNFDQNNALRPVGPTKIDPAMKQSVNLLHQKFKQLERSHPELAKLLVEGEKVNRKLFTMQMATYARNILDSHAKGASSDAAQDLIRQFDKKLDILMDTKGLTNSDAAKHADALAATLHDNLVEMFGVLKRKYAHGDLHDDLDIVRRSYERAWADPYMHLGRHGMNSIAFNVVDSSPQTVAKLNALLGTHGFVFGPFSKGATDVFLRVDSVDEMKQIYDKLKRSTGLVATKDGQMVLNAGGLSDVGVDNMAGVSKAMEALRKRMQDRFDTKPGDSEATREAFNAVKAMLNQEFLDMLEVNSAKQVNQVRKGVVGYSADYMQNFAKRAQWSDASISNQYTTRGYTKAFSDMQATVNALRVNDPLQATKGQDIYDEVATRFSNSLKPNTSPLVHAMSVMGHNFYLALSPAYVIGNVTQPYVVTLPLLGGRFGFVRSAKAMAKASSDTLALIRDAMKSGWVEGKGRGLLELKLDFAVSGLAQRELDFLQHLIRSGIVDASQAQELGRLAKGELSATATAAKTMSVFNHYSEVLNRLSAGLAAYRLADKLSEADRTTYAIDVVRRTQFDYADHNTARFIGRHGVFGAATPLFVQFQRFSFGMMENYIRMFKDGFLDRLPREEDRVAARKALGGTLVMTTLVAGAMGLPFATVLAAAANGFGDDDKDARARYRDWLASVFGKAGGEMIAKGVISRSLGVDMTGSIGHQDLLPGSRWMADRRQWDDKVKDMSKSMLGPAVNAGFDIYSGVEKAKAGDVMGGIKAMIPRALKGPVEAVRTAEEGAFVNKSGTTLPIPVTGWDYFKMALGLTPARKAEQSEANFYYQSELSQAKQDKRRATKNALRAQHDGDIEEMADTIATYNAAHPHNRISNFGALIQAQARGQAVAAATGTGIIDSNRRHLPTLLDYTAYNTGVE